MKIVIDIPEEKYNQIINSYQGSKVRPKDYEIAIINGTPLDKIRAEIGAMSGDIETIADVLVIIDKYREDKG